MIREATGLDAGAIAAVHVASWGTAYRGLLPDEYLDAMDVERWANGWRRVLAGGRPAAAGTLVAERNGSVVGFADVAPSRDDDAAPGTGEVTSIYVRPDAWSTGAGRALLTAATERLRDAGFASAALWVLRDNRRARRFYECAGWSSDGAEKAAQVAGAWVTEVRYRRDI